MRPRHDHRVTAARSLFGRRRWRSTSALLGVAVAAASLSLVQAPGATASIPSLGNHLAAGVVMQPRESLLSVRNGYRLTLLRDGDLVLYHNNVSVWRSHTAGHVNATAELTHNGFFVIRHADKVLWETPAYSGHIHASSLTLDSNGQLVITNAHNDILWSIRQPPTLSLGSQGDGVLALQRRLTTLGYWLGTPDGYFGDSTQQAVWAFQKAAGETRDGVVGAQTWADLYRGVEPTIRAAKGNLIEVNLHLDLLMIIRHGTLWATLNTSTGGGYTYVFDGVTDVAITPTGRFHIYAVIDGTDTDALGTLWRPRFFEGGDAIHGDGYVPPEPVSHGCVRVSDEAINWIWAENLAPIGSEVWVY